MTAYLIASMNVHSPDIYEDYKAEVPAHIKAHGGRYIVRGGACDVVEGTWPAERIAVLEFPDFDSANAFVDDPAYAPVAAIRQRAAESHLWIVEGHDSGATADGLHAFLIANVRMTDPEAYKPYAEQVPAVMADAAGTFLARGGATRSVEGGMALDRLVIVGFRDLGAVRAFHGGDAYAPLIKIRRSASDSNVVIVEGL